MKLTYRGVSYENTPANGTQAAYVGPAVDLKYRGASYRRGEVAKVERLGAIFKYRGAAYSYEPTAQVEEPVAPVAAAPAMSHDVEAKARLLTLNHSREIRNRQHSMLARTAAEVGFSAKLSNYWNQVQGEIDSTLWSEYDRSNAALS